MKKSRGRQSTKITRKDSLNIDQENSHDSHNPKATDKLDNEFQSTDKKQRKNAFDNKLRSANLKPLNLQKFPSIKKIVT